MLKNEFPLKKARHQLSIQLDILLAKILSVLILVSVNFRLL